MDTTKRQIAEMIDEVLRLKDVMVVRQINASTCRTDTDWRKAHEAQEAFDNKYGELMDLLATS